MGARPLSPLPPIYAVLGCTGTGKTKLGIELARKVGGHVINVDAMQLYKGLPITTNQASEEERQGVPHHLLSVLDPLETRRYTARHFQLEAMPLIASLRSAGTPPVLVGGTLYYLESLLWDYLLLDEDDAFGDESDEECDLSNEELHAMLAEKDPEAALKNHPNNRRKVFNALRYFKMTGKTHSERLGEQHGNEGQISGKRRFPPGEVVAFLVNSDKLVLDHRLDKRVMKMIEAGLIQELKQFYALGSKQEKDGIWQSIGLKEFLPYLKLSEEDQNGEKGQKVLRESINQLQVSNRQYARRQMKWIRNRFLTRPPSHSIALFCMDTTDPERWDTAVSDPLDRILEFHRRRSTETPPPGGFPNDFTFFEGCPIEPMRQRPAPSFTPAEHRCNVCNGQLFTTEEQWREHIRSRKHNKRLKSQRKRAKEEEMINGKTRKTNDEKEERTEFELHSSADGNEKKDT